VSFRAHVDRRTQVLRPLAEAQRTLLEIEARGDRMPRHEQRERMLDAMDLLRSALEALWTETVRRTSFATTHQTTGV